MVEFGHFFLSLLTLFFLEVVLGVDNLIFISIASARLPEEQQAKARVIGLVIALALRLVLLAFISYLAGLTAPLVKIADIAISTRDLLLTGGGLFLIYKATTEIHSEFQEHRESSTPVRAQLLKVILQIAVLDLNLKNNDIRELYGAGLVLVRPDQIIGWRGSDCANPVELWQLLMGQP